MQLDMRSVKILSLFDNKGVQAFFKPLNTSNEMSLSVVDEAVVESRLQFLDRVVTLSVSLLGDASDINDAELQHVIRVTGYSEWSYLALQLGQLFELDPDFVASKQCVQLYSSGFDSWAEQTLQPVSKTHELGLALLPLAGVRLKLVVFCREVSLRASRIAMCSTSLSNWLQSLDSKMATNTTTTMLQLENMLLMVCLLLNRDVGGQFKRADEMLQIVRRGF